MSAENLELVQAEFAAGQATFERGLYRESVQHLEKASALVARNSRLGGEVQMWLVTAYEAAGQRSDAIALCQQVSRHPHYEIRKQGKRLLFILEAPKLSTRPEWLTQIPDLGAISEQDPKDRMGGGGGTSRKSTGRKSDQPDEPEPPMNLAQTSPLSDRFLWLAILTIILILGGFAWFA